MSLALWLVYLLSVWAIPAHGDSLLWEAAAVGAPQEMLLAVWLNDQDVRESIRALRLADSQVLVHAEDLQRWRLRVPSVTPLSYEEEHYYPLDQVGGLSYRVDESTQQLLLQVRPESFVPTVIGGAPEGLVSPTLPPWGGFVNYDLLWQRIESNNRFDGFFEFGLFNRWGVGVGTFLLQDVGRETDVLRLETNWTRDQPDKLTSVRLGDTVGRAGS